MKQMRLHATIPILLFAALSACKTTNVLHLKHKKYYSESSTLTGEKGRGLLQVVSFNQPFVIDEEFSFELSFQFIDTAAAKIKRVLNLATDTAIVKIKYDLVSVWNWEDESYSLRGTIEILKWTTNSITLKQKVIVDDKRRKKVIKFFGHRTFTK